MCFSASASFGAAILLTGVGTLTLKKVQNRNQIPFAAIPLLFAIHQVLEGLVWLALTKSGYDGILASATHFYLFFAQILWPVWIPVAIFFLVPKERRNLLHKGLVIAGGLIAAYLTYCLITYPVNAYILGHHMAYDQTAYPKDLRTYIAAPYLLVILLPLFISGIRNMWVLGVLGMVSYGVTAIFYSDFKVSVWCFFAAIISTVVYIIVAKLKPDAPVPND